MNKIGRLLFPILPTASMASRIVKNPSVVIMTMKTTIRTEIGTTETRAAIVSPIMIACT